MLYVAENRSYTLLCVTVSQIIYIVTGAKNIMQKKEGRMRQYVTFVLFMGRSSWEKPIKVYELLQMQVPLTGRGAQVCVMCVSFTNTERARRAFSLTCWADS